MPKPAMAIINPASANGKTRLNWPTMKKGLEEAGLEFDFAFTSCPAEATHLTSEALHKGYGTIISVGGDGTLNEVVNGFFAGDELINSQARLGIIAAGTGGDFIRTLEYPKDFNQAAQLIVKGQTRLIDLGRLEFINHRGQSASSYYINIAGFGMDGAVVDRVNKTSKFFGGFASFLYGTLAALASFKSVPVTLEIDGQLVWEGPTTVVAIANGKFFGGSMQIAPAAVLDDGLFEVVLVRGMPKASLLRCLPTIYSGTHINNPVVSCFKGARIKAASTGRVLLNVDGEQPGILNAELSLLPQILNIIC